MQRHQFEITNLLSDSSYYIQVQAMSINGRRRLKSEKCSILHNTTITPTQGYSPLKCGKEQQIMRSGDLNYMYSEDRYTNLNSKHNTLNDEPSSSSSSAISHNTQNLIQTNNNNHSNSSTYNFLPTFEVKYRLNRKLGMLVIISGFNAREEK